MHRLWSCRCSLVSLDVLGRPFSHGCLGLCLSKDFVVLHPHVVLCLAFRISVTPFETEGVVPRHGGNTFRYSQGWHFAGTEGDVSRHGGNAFRYSRGWHFARIHTVPFIGGLSCAWFCFIYSWAVRLLNHNARNHSRPRTLASILAWRAPPPQVSEMLSLLFAIVLRCSIQQN